MQRLEKLIRDKHDNINHIFIESRALSENSPPRAPSKKLGSTAA
ncbi:MAG TPA: hypothetical protein VJQ55_15280 [Candidatus Binatia bacterium]|nr:hypothetical protein [Candidatus Binatia bacterium]